MNTTDELDEILERYHTRWYQAFTEVIEDGDDNTDFREKMATDEAKAALEAWSRQQTTKAWADGYHKGAEAEAERGRQQTAQILDKLLSQKVEYEVTDLEFMEYRQNTPLKAVPVSVIEALRVGLEGREYECSICKSTHKNHHNSQMHQTMRSSSDAPDGDERSSDD